MVHAVPTNRVELNIPCGGIHKHKHKPWRIYAARTINWRVLRVAMLSVQFVDLAMNTCELEGCIH